ncbi:MAG: RNA-guided pseudouridylation complex pseudouridine synthase subunit Cbf5 [Candidatus Parvarchaeota archaeon]|nr:RNA-guided pseudouridylation complex pseudouridine synthase subunit Cbf5 [Candidatus Parvarchaeota archaeon]MCL5101347.1 RNA-guided pseudouridylation complex pseudouridine synthase subunit Cbf5 [Candidatus Parvarchaeota archaeon]
MKLPIENVKHETFTLYNETTDDKYGFYPEKRTLKQRIDSGFILLDKPPHARSKTAAAIAKKLISPLGVTKVGYSGTLDPNVTGLLPLAINNANKVISVLLFGGKEYVALMHLHKEVEEEKLKKTFENFRGKIMQLPPVRSSVKRQYREREIYYSEIIDIVDKNVLFKIGVQSGTYIRKFISDLGDKLGVGANMVELRRTKVSTLSEKNNLVTLQDLEDAMYYYEKENDEALISYAFQNIETAVDFLPKVYISDSAVDVICHGSPLAVPGIVKLNNFESGETLSLSTLKGELIGLGKAILSSKDILNGGKGLAVKTDSVVMKPGMYPKYEKKNITVAT